ncbi:MAG: hypothetical protein ACRDOE_04965, partial [Streptosporangiaceae bacterium]
MGFIGAFHSHEKFHRCDGSDRSIIGTESLVDVKLAALDRDEDTRVQNYSPGHPRTSFVNAETKVRRRAFEVIGECLVGWILTQGGLKPVRRCPPFRREPAHRDAVTGDHHDLAMLD